MTGAAGLLTGTDWGLPALAAIGGMLLGAALAACLARLRHGDAVRRGRLLELAINNMTQGVVMFDAGGRLIVCNERYLQIYNLSRDIIKPGATLEDVIRHRAATGSLQLDPE